MQKLFASCGLALDDRGAERLEIFRRLLKEENAKYNLTSITEDGEIALKHFADSAAGADLFPHGARVAEIGSGGGFPSVPLMIVRPDLSFTLIESTAKKCAFLERAARELGLNARVLQGRAEELARTRELRDAFDAATARAVARLNTLCEYCMPFVRPGGVFVAYKGDAEEEIAEAGRAIAALGGKLRLARRYELGTAGRRTLIAVDKISPTDGKYPRGRGKERSKPL